MHLEESNIYEKQLIQRIQSGDKQAFEDLYRTYFPVLCDFVYRYVRSSSVSEELVQDLFLNIWIRRTEWEPEGTIRSYLYKSARNRAFDYLKHQKVERNYLEERKIERKWEQESNRADVKQLRFYKEQSVNEELVQAVENALNQLPERRKVIFTLSREEGLTYKEIADVLNISVKTVETQMGRALKILREQLCDYLPGLMILTESIRNIV